MDDGRGQLCCPKTATTTSLTHLDFCVVTLPLRLQEGNFSILLNVVGGCPRTRTKSVSVTLGQAHPSMDWLFCCFQPPATPALGEASHHGRSLAGLQPPCCQEAPARHVDKAMQQRNAGKSHDAPTTQTQAVTTQPGSWPDSKIYAPNH